jgi:predicted nuclease of restriction endonuclease-like (RecB) superfamily
MKNELTKTGYGPLLTAIKERIRKAQRQALRAVNRELVSLYWDMGKMIFRLRNTKGWGMRVVERFSSDLQREFPGTRGFSAQNLWRMTQFYGHYRNSPILSTLSRELPWFHNVLILNRTSTDKEKAFYLRSARDQYWSFRELERQIDAGLFERAEAGKKPPAVKQRGKKERVLAHFKNEYVLDFLRLGENFKEKDLRKAILANLKDFFLEFGRYFTFAGEEYRLNVGGEDFFVDLLFYHRRLRCFVAVELKTGHFRPEYAGQMQFYLSAIDEKIKDPLENPSVGILLCKSKNEEVVRIATSRALSPLKIATYRTNLIDQKLLKRKLHSLPAPTS